jgi:hypothetical protein
MYAATIFLSFFYKQSYHCKEILRSKQQTLAESPSLFLRSSQKNENESNANLLAMETEREKSGNQIVLWSQQSLKKQDRWYNRLLPCCLHPQLWSRPRKRLAVLYLPPSG